jgi:hypothetical protein
MCGKRSLIGASAVSVVLAVQMCGEEVTRMAIAAPHMVRMIGDDGTGKADHDSN